MYFIIYFDIASLVILLFLVGGIIFRKQYDSRANKFYLITTIATIFTAVFDIVASLTALPVWALTLTNTIYFLFRFATTFFFVLYVIASSHLWGRFAQKKVLSISFCFPILIIIALFIINIFTNWIFYYEDDKSYHREFLIYAIYGINYLYGAVGVGILIATSKSSSIFKLIALLCASVLQAAASIIQFFSGSLLLEVFSCTSSLLILWAFVERSSDYLEYNTRIYNSNAFHKYIKEKIDFKKEFNVILIHINNMSRLFSLYKRRITLDVLREVSLKLTSNAKKIDRTSHTYYIEQSTFAVVHNDSTKTQEMVNYIDSYLTSVIEIKDDINFAFQPKICSVQYPIDFIDSNSLLNFAFSFFNIIDCKGSVIDIKNYQVSNEINLLFALDKILDNAIKEKSFEMYFQPIYSVKKKNYVSAESLVRLNHPIYGFISPSVFIPYAEKTGRMNEIGNIILEKCFEILSSKEFQELNIEFIEINLSILQLLDIDLIARINSLATQYNINKKQINFELTETVAIAGDPVIENNIFNLSKEGYNLSLDDFGVGYSNLARLLILPFDVIKADKMIIDRLNNKDSKDMFEKLIQLISSGNLKLVAEGVETKEKFEKVLTLDFDYIQGYYLSMPLPPKAFVEFIKSHN
ncbi:MAG: EAL domain-containing protein [Bacilli bacterium]|nr:EAL domain-containing protein [Bacilli bacterium]